MELVIRVDMEKAQQSLAEIFKLIGDCRLTDEVKDEETAGTLTVVRNGKSLVVGTWEVEESEEQSKALDSASMEPSYRAAAMARYAQPNRIEVDRFATVSQADDGAYVQGWLHVSQAEVGGSGNMTLSKKPPQPAQSLRNLGTRAG
ncbi:MAG TPA: hypothetical protein VGL22_16395 [Terracidiphilus sp.]|jgi:hypothetical protein